MGRASFITACLAAASFLPVLPAAAAAPSSVAAFLHVRHTLGASVEPALLLSAAQQNPAAFRGQVFEVPATVTGLMTDNGQETVMLTVSPQVTLSALVPASLVGAVWLVDTGSRLRALVKENVQGNEQSLSSLTLVAAAPEYDVETVEKAAAAQAQATRAREEAAMTRRYTLLASRSLPYRRQTQVWPAPEAGGGQPTAALSADAQRVYPAYRQEIRRLNSRLSDSDVDLITTNLLGFSDLYQVDPRLVMAMMIAESGFNIDSTSRTGAMGLGQLMPETARGLGVTNAYDPAQNIAASIRLLRGHLDQYGGRISLTMAAYNAGPGAVRKYHGIPPYRETQHYVAKVKSLYRELCGA
jgi:soluble lytic murein transglycosylase-like protein